MKRLRVLLAALTVLALAFAQMASAALTNRYVVKDNSGALAPYDAWGNAAGDIQTAINYAYAGETVLVAAATYDTGGITNWPAGTILTNRIAIWKAITVRSADNDPTNTIIKGAMDHGTNGPASVRCVYMTNGSALIGFTLTNGATFQRNYLATGTNDNHYGGGVWCESTNTVISNCLLVANMAADFGGGAYKGTLYNCTIFTNTILAIYPQGTYGCGTYDSTLYNCTIINNWGKSGNSYGGGTYGGIRYNCMLASNASSYGGGAYGGYHYNCTFIDNYAWNTGGGTSGGIIYNSLYIGNYSGLGGGAYKGILYNCTVVGNYARINGGGMNSNTANNCIVYFNTSADPIGSNWYDMVRFTNSCTAAEATSGSGNITANPQFMDTNTSNYRLSAHSPCINTGTNGSWTTSYPYDLDGRTRIRYGQVDMGAYERFHAGTICGVH